MRRERNTAQLHILCKHPKRVGSGMVTICKVVGTGKTLRFVSGNALGLTGCDLVSKLVESIENAPSFIPRGWLFVTNPVSAQP